MAPNFPSPDLAHQGKESFRGHRENPYLASAPREGFFAGSACTMVGRTSSDCPAMRVPRGTRGSVNTHTHTHSKSSVVSNWLCSPAPLIEFLYSICDQCLSMFEHLSFAFSEEKSSTDKNMRTKKYVFCQQEDSCTSVLGSTNKVCFPKDVCMSYRPPPLRRVHPGCPFPPQVPQLRTQVGYLIAQHGSFGYRGPMVKRAGGDWAPPNDAV